MVLLFQNNGTRYEFDAVLYDLDGTLVTTANEYRQRAVEGTLDLLGLETPHGFADRFWFGADREMIVQRELDITIEQFYDAFAFIDLPGLRSMATNPFADVLPVLEQLAGRVKQGIVTACPTEKAAPVIAKIGRDYFESIVVANHFEGVPSKPNPWGVNVCLEELGVAAEKAIYVGNANEDVGAARNAGVVSCIVDRGEFVLTEKPMVRIPDLYSLVKDL